MADVRDTGFRMNPFIPAGVPEPEVVELDEPDAVWNDALALRGPSTPAAVPGSHIEGLVPWPTRNTLDRPRLTVIGLHGGAAATTLCSLLGEGAVDGEGAWPIFTGWDRPMPDMPVLAVARTHHAGVAAASRFARLWGADQLHSSRLLGIVMVDDGPKLTQQQRLVARRIGQMTPHGWHIPWQEYWRHESPNAATVGGRLRRVLANIRSLAATPGGSL
jgi:hypothetical protein